MKPCRATGFAIASRPHIIQYALCDLSSFNNLIKRIFVRIKVNYTKRWIFRLFNRTAPGVHFNAAKICHIEQCGFVLAHKIMTVLFICFTVVEIGLCPFRCRISHVLKIKTFAFNAVRKTVHTLWPILKIGQYKWSSLIVIIDEVSFGYSLFRPKHLI